MFQVIRVMTVCPETKRLVDTGAQASSRAELETAYPWEQRVHCPHCGQSHTWLPEDAYLQVIENLSADPATWRPNR